MPDERFRDMAIRSANAELAFLAYLEEDRNFSHGHARAIADLYRNETIVRFGFDGQWRIIHGAFLDQDVLESAATA